MTIWSVVSMYYIYLQPFSPKIFKFWVGVILFIIFDPRLNPYTLPSSWQIVYKLLLLASKARSLKDPDESVWI